MPKSFPEAELEAAAGAAPVERRRVRSGGYGTNSAHWCVELADGRRAFVKVALDEAAAEWLRQEHRVYSAVEAPFIPELLGWHDGEQTLLAIADLSDAHWPPPWTSGQIDAVRAALDELHATPPPPDLPPIAAEREWLNGWELVAEDPEPLLSTALCSPPWLKAALPSLLETGRSCLLEGEAFLHLDVRSDNLCLQEGRAALVDWNLAHIGNPLLDMVGWLPSLKLEGGPDPLGPRPRQPRIRSPARRLLRVPRRPTATCHRAAGPRVPAPPGRDCDAVGRPRARAPAAVNSRR